ncbi:hypothetical protein GOP47_0016794 [Adiantum capillus-veneris]|uniref:Remorin C-terminal domain-containing protein n=1 Tax=Adiantum capillus-veneris TaxID=13818 RepID=A0A9D4UID2_ADICA|nr:hypothetical protein GOP47_0016794 [Adiantum capillus-veneris]
MMVVVAAAPTAPASSSRQYKLATPPHTQQYTLRCMAAFKQKASGSSYGHPLPFRSRESMNQQLDQSPHVSWAPLKKDKELSFHKNSDKNGFLFSSANKENVRSWLESTSPTSVLNSSANQQDVDGHPPSPSPVCSPSASTPAFSPFVSKEQVCQEAYTEPSTMVNPQNSNKSSDSQAQFDGKKLEEPASTSRRHGKDVFSEPTPDSPTGSNFSSGSEGGLLALLASKLLSYKENGRRFSRYARESSGPIDEKHVMEDRSKKPPVEEINTTRMSHLHPQPQESDMISLSRSSGLYRTASEAVSELSLGSANGRTLSMEFDAMLAAAVATGIQQASTVEDQRQQLLPEIQEDSSLRFGRVGQVQQSNADARALVRVGDGRQAVSDDEAGRLTRALTVMRQGRDSEDLDTLSELPISSQSSISHGSRRAYAEENNNLQIVPTTVGIMVEPAEVDNLSARSNRESSLESSPCGSNGDHRLAMVLATHVSNPSEPTLSSSSSSSQSKEKNMMLPVPLPPCQALAKVRKNRIFAQALAYQDAKSSKCNNRYKREETKINAWENQQKIEASMRMKKVEMRLEQKRAKALEKMQNEIARAHKMAEERKASAEAVRAAKTARVAQEADAIRRTGRVPSTANVGCFPF